MLAERIVAWFDREKRDLPWRRTSDAYAVWISEAMLQQTRVETVIPYYTRFLERFPDVHALAEAQLESVLTAWAGLGYYRRARSLHAGAREIVARFGGALPNDPARLREIPGVGPYTAGAIASIAFQERAPLVDGNVARVLSRLFAIDEPIDAPATVKRLWQLAGELVPAHRPGDYNQALMELGAMVCKVESPRCELCPLALECRARAQGRAQELPKTTRKKAPRRERLTAALTMSGETVVLARRKPDGLFGGMFEPPLVVGRGKRAVRELAAMGLARRPGRPLGTLVHVLTHRALEISVVAVSAASQLVPNELYDQLALVPRARLSSVPLSTLAKKILAVEESR